MPGRSHTRSPGMSIMRVRPGGDNVLQSDIADLSDHCPVISLQTLEDWLCQWPSLAGMEHCALHTRAVHTATCFEREMA